MTAVDDLAAWLTQIWDEQERLAKKATPGPWRYNAVKHTRLPGTPIFEEAVFAGPVGKAATTIAATGETDDPQSMTDAAFIASHDPAAVLARIAADRQILALHSRALGVIGPDSCETDDEDWPCTTVRMLALPQADRPGYQEAWRP